MVVVDDTSSEVVVELGVGICLVPSGVVVEDEEAGVSVVSVVEVDVVVPLAGNCICLFLKAFAARAKTSSSTTTIALRMAFSCWPMSLSSAKDTSALDIPGRSYRECDASGSFLFRYTTTAIRPRVTTRMEMTV